MTLFSVTFLRYFTKFSYRSNQDLKLQKS